MKKPKPIEKWLAWRALLSAQQWIVFIASVAIILVITYGVLMRYIIHHDVPAIEEILVIFGMWLYFIGASLGSHDDSHIHADFFTSYCHKPKVLRVHQAFVYGVIVVINIILIIWAIKYVMWIFDKPGQSINWRFPLSWSKMPIAISIFLMMVYSIYHFVRRAMNHFEPLPAEEDEETTNTGNDIDNVTEQETIPAATDAEPAVPPKADEYTQERSTD